MEALPVKRQGLPLLMWVPASVFIVVGYWVSSPYILTFRKVDKSSTSPSRLLIEAAPDGMIEINRKGRVLLVIAKICSLFGYIREALLDHNQNSGFQPAKQKR